MTHASDVPPFDTPPSPDFSATAGASGSLGPSGAPEASGVESSADEQSSVLEQASASPLVQETRRQISDIVREVAAEARRDQPRRQFLGLLVDRVMRAMAAEGVIVWGRHEVRNPEADHARCVGAATEGVGLPREGAELGYQPLARLGMVTDLSLPESGRLVHQRLLAEIGHNGQPMVVPATPGACEPQTAANPASVPVGVVPILLYEMDGPADYLLEVFLEPGGGVATQRGYLRFAAQMADLAGEFLRADQMRTWRRRASLASQIDAMAIRLHRLIGRRSIESRLVDGVAELFGFARVGLCLLEGTRSRLVAVSHVETIDQDSAAAEQLRQASRIELDNDNSRWFSGSPSPGQSERSSAAVAGRSEPAESAGPVEACDAGSLSLRAVAAPTPESNWRLVCWEHPDSPVDEAVAREELARLVRHGSLSAERAAAWEALPGGRWLSSWATGVATRTGTGLRSRGSRLRHALLWGVPLLVALVAAYPAPLVVTAAATLRPADVQLVCAHRDAVVKTIHVQHGDHVSAGDPLLTLTDPELEERIATLSGRRAILVEQQSRWTEAIVDGTYRDGSAGGGRRYEHQADRYEQLIGEQRLAEEEIRSVDQQLAILRRIDESLILRADRPGRVDGWRLADRLRGRPLRRGDEVLRVIADGSAWVAEARVPHHRIHHLWRSEAEGPPTGVVSLTSDPERTWNVSLDRIGPVVDSEDGGAMANVIRLQLESGAAVGRGSELAGRQLQDRALQRTESYLGSPARVRLNCGRAPVAYVLFQDVFQSLRGCIGLYFSSPPTEES